ncbi:MAG: DUF423 domain-containing protein [Filomicrobium sp.]
MSTFALALIIVAGLLGAGGVSLAAIAAHVADSTALRAAAEIAVVHAAATIGLLVLGRHSQTPASWTIPAAVMVLGATLFSATVALGVLADFRPVPALAPIGGTLTILSWLAVSVAGLRELLIRHT